MRSTLPSLIPILIFMACIHQEQTDKGLNIHRQTFKDKYFMVIGFGPVPMRSSPNPQAPINDYLPLGEYLLPSGPHAGEPPISIYTKDWVSVKRVNGQDASARAVGWVDTKNLSPRTGRISMFNLETVRTNCYPRWNKKIPCLQETETHCFHMGEGPGGLADCYSGSNYEVIQGHIFDCMVAVRLPPSKSGICNTKIRGEIDWYFMMPGILIDSDPKHFMIRLSLFDLVYDLDRKQLISIRFADTNRPPPTKNIPRLGVTPCYDRSY